MNQGFFLIIIQSELCHFSSSVTSWLVSNVRSQKSAQDETPLQTRGDMKHCSPLSVHLHWVHTAEADPEPEADPEASCWARVGLPFFLHTLETQADEACKWMSVSPLAPFWASVMETEWLKRRKDLESRYFQCKVFLRNLFLLIN